eukprot:CAMPEP_0117042488 /NCGR_PEP_ID=MMETSP0472-20121206/29585_1 /TAXON_ID=693140 ORGANISM="Tiarina fusus, Strain LIS" /NCGR_SAMPLE_ID=MMETSP0472 /ASSEMBLY_ACC=CAM_ASM_000603 /LENGTH=423 /DNA_ID=CAMNT_0004753741 /DNA_START=78 /DNA_END=1349 /DNA_ORIENTATION=+
MGTCQSISLVQSPPDKKSTAKSSSKAPSSRRGGGSTCSSSSSCDRSSIGESNASTLNRNRTDNNNNNDNREELLLRATLHEHLLRWKRELDGAEGSVHVNIELLSNSDEDGDRPIEAVYEGANNGPDLGEGSSGVVRRVKNRKTGLDYAAKCFDLSVVSEDLGGRKKHINQWIEALHEEIFSMCELDHPGIVHLEEVYESETHLYLIEELCNGGDMFVRLHNQKELHYSEEECAGLVQQILSAVGYMHSKHIMHRDLKLENLVFSSASATAENRQEDVLKVIDFGFSKHFSSSGEIQHEPVGTPYVAAPEVIRGAYDEKADIWALGVITFILLCGDTPFGGLDDERMSQIRENILRGTVEFEPEYYWQNASDGAKAFVLRLLNPDATQRPSAAEAQLDPWLLSFFPKIGSAPPTISHDPEFAR